MAVWRCGTLVRGDLVREDCVRWKVGEYLETWGMDGVGLLLLSVLMIQVC
jgi:hypothetical protein